ncbi:MAG: Crp/Fnr family transcriptional regulator [Flavobacteriia bacterium]|nr:Crp/Fnr family transcriptional regulator [Flavobacteriia bacterium]
MTKKNNSLVDFIESSPLLSVCDKKWIDFILERKTIFHIKKKQFVFSEKEKVLGVYFVCKGLVKVFKNGIGDKCQIIRFSKKGNIIGHRGWNKEFMPISAVAVEDSDILMISTEDFTTLLENNPKLTYTFLEFFSEELYQSENKMKNLSLMNIHEKLADSLLYLENKFGVNKKNQIDIVLSRKDLADFAGISEKQVSKILSEWAFEKILILEKKNISILQKKYLQELLKGKIIAH